MLFRSPSAAQALFRLLRASERGEARREDIALKPSAQNPRRPSWLRVSVRPFAGPANKAANSDGRDTLVLWKFADISDDKNREAQKIGGLEASLAAFDTMPAGFLSVAANGTIIHANATFEGWLGLARGTTAARAAKLSDIASEDGAKLLFDLALDPDAERRVTDLDLTREDGRIVPLTLYAEPAGRTVGAGFTVTDRKSVV